jgi:peptidoglycan/LPS O-acetylase OafA/YrhL
MTLQTRVTAGRENLSRVVAAGAVLVSHAYPICSGPATPERLARVLGMNLGTLAVLIFFLIPGNFVSQSFDNRRGLVEFAATGC